jgi:hypothetical protein
MLSLVEAFIESSSYSCLSLINKNPRGAGILGFAIGDLSA